MQVGRTIRALVALAVLGMLLGACGDSADPTLGPAAAAPNGGVAAATDQARNVVAAAFVGTGAAALASFPGLPSTNGGALPSGRFRWSGKAGWTRQAASDALLLWWPFGGRHGHQASLRIDWAAGQPALTVAGAGGRPRSVPAAALATLSVDGRERGSLRVGLGWHATPCGVVAQPDQLRAAGALSGNGDRLELKGVSLSLTGSDGATTLTSAGSWSAASGTAGATLGWNVTLHGSIFRDPGSCLPTGVTVSGGRVRLHLTGAGYDVGISATFSDVTRTKDGAMLSAKLSDGRVSIDGADAFAFSGTLDDANGDGIPGEEVTVTSAAGARMDGETFLRRNARGLLQGVRALAELTP